MAKKEKAKRIPTYKLRVDVRIEDSMLDTKPCDKPMCVPRHYSVSRLIDQTSALVMAKYYTEDMVEKVREMVSKAIIETLGSYTGEEVK